MPIFRKYRRMTEEEQKATGYRSDMEEFQEKMRAEYGPMYFDRQGKEINMMDWSLKCEDIDYKIVKQEQVGKYFISTIWLGVNMELFPRNPPLIFETMIFINEDKENDDLNLYQERYSTEQEALIGHEEVINLVKNRMASVTPPP